MRYESFKSHFPLTFRVDPYCGFNLPNGWFDIVDALCGRLEALLRAADQETRDGFSVDQVKSKYARLAFYVSGETEEMRSAISDAERDSRSFCETCGDAGNVCGVGWLVVECDKCRINKKLSS